MSLLCGHLRLNLPKANHALVFKVKSLMTCISAEQYEESCFVIFYVNTLLNVHPFATAELRTQRISLFLCRGKSLNTARSKHSHVSLLSKQFRLYLVHFILVMNQWSNHLKTNLMTYVRPLTMCTFRWVTLQRDLTSDGRRFDIKVCEIRRKSVSETPELSFST